MQVPLIAFESGLGVLVLGWAVWELISLRREQARDRIRAEARRTDSGSTDSPSRPTPPRC